MNKAGSRVWARTLGSSEDDACHGLEVSGKDVYLIGSTSGVVEAHDGGEEEGGGEGLEDMLLARVSTADGKLVWVHQHSRHGTKEVGWDLSVHKSTICLTGVTNGDLFGDGKVFADGSERVFFGHIGIDGKHGSLTGVQMKIDGLKMARTSRVVLTPDRKQAYVLVSGTKDDDSTMTFYVLKLQTKKPFKEVKKLHTPTHRKKNKGITGISGLSS